MEAKTPNTGNDQQSTPVDHLRAFELYLAMGTGRSIKKLVEAMRVQTGQEHKYKKLEAWSSRHGWQARIKEVERESEAAGVAEYIAGAPLATAKALQAIGSVMNLAESLMHKAAANKDIEIKSVDDLAKVGKLINDAAKLAEVLQGRPNSRSDITGAVAVDHDERRALADALAKLETKRIAENEARGIPDIDSPGTNVHGAVIDANYTEINQPVSDPVSTMHIMTFLNDDDNDMRQSDGPPAVGDTMS